MSSTTDNQKFRWLGQRFPEFAGIEDNPIFRREMGLQYGRPRLHPAEWLDHLLLMLPVLLICLPYCCCIFGLILAPFALGFSQLLAAFSGVHLGRRFRDEWERGELIQIYLTGLTGRDVIGGLVAAQLLRTVRFTRRFVLFGWLGLAMLVAYSMRFGGSWESIIYLTLLAVATPITLSGAVYLRLALARVQVRQTGRGFASGADLARKLGLQYLLWACVPLAICFAINAAFTAVGLLFSFLSQFLVAMMLDYVVYGGVMMIVLYLAILISYPIIICLFLRKVTTRLVTALHRQANADFKDAIRRLAEGDPRIESEKFKLF